MAHLIHARFIFDDNFTVAFIFMVLINCSSNFLASFQDTDQSPQHLETSPDHKDGFHEGNYKIWVLQVNRKIYSQNDNTDTQEHFSAHNYDIKYLPFWMVTDFSFNKINYHTPAMAYAWKRTLSSEGRMWQAAVKWKWIIDNLNCHIYKLWKNKNSYSS